MYKITGSKGFHITFANGVTVSVQFGAGNYCDNKDAWDGYDFKDFRPKTDIKCNNAEIAIFKEGSVWLTPEYTGEKDDVVIGWIDTCKLLEVLKWAENYGKKNEDSQ